jgi:putative acetyltransferase
MTGAGSDSAVRIDDSVIVRREDSGERAAIRLINEAAFGRPDEADLVDGLRNEGVVLASLIAEREKRLVGHILFSRMWIETTSQRLSAVALAPMAVLPERQHHGIGGKLIGHGLDLLRGQGEQIVIVLGHPEYYPRFGFSTGKARCLASPFPPEAFMALELTPGALDGVRGTVKYPDAFSSASAASRGRAPGCTTSQEQSRKARQARGPESPTIS